MTFGRFLLGSLVILMVVLPGCDGGLGPIVEPTGFSGVITYKNWPPSDSLLELRLVVFEEIPTDSAGLIVAVLSAAQNLEDVKAAIYPPLGPGHSVAEALQVLGNNNADSVKYEFLKESTWLKERTYKYVVLAWRYGPMYFSDWAPAGVYTYEPGSTLPAPVVVRANRLLKDINISVDFHNLPPLPWRH
jgi:hypothetical protein